MSGASLSVLSVTAAKIVGKAHEDYDDEISGLNGRVKEIYRADKVDVIFAGLRDPLRDVLLMNLDGLSSENGIELSGIIGIDTLRLLTVDVDYRDGLVHIVFDPKHGENQRIPSP